MDRPLGALTNGLIGRLAAVLALSTALLPAGLLTPTLTPSATAVEPALGTGRHPVTLPTDAPTQYLLRRTAPGSTFHVAVVFIGAGDSIGEGIHLQIGTTAGGEGCGSGGAFRPTRGEPAPVLFTTVSTWTDDPDHECATIDELHLTVAVPTEVADRGRPAELLIYEEPALSTYAFDLLPEPAAPGWAPLEATGKRRAVTPGDTPGNAPVVGDGGHRLTLTRGGTALLAVPLDWDQSVAVQLDARLPAGSGPRNPLSVDILGPLLGTSQISFLGRVPPDWTTTLPADGGKVRTGAQSQVVSYAHRDSYDSALNTEALAGMHYLLIRWRDGDDADQVVPAIPVTVTVRTTGTAGEGTPAYSTAGDLPPPRADSRLYDGSLVAEPAPEPSGTAASERPAAAADDVGPDPILLVAGTLAVGVIGALALTIRAVLRRRRLRRRHRSGRHRA